MNLTETLREPEGKTLEFKRDLSSPERFLRTVVAFANTSGGTILVGIEDRSRHIRGVTEPLALEERAVNLISDSIRPRLMPDLEIVSYRNRQLLAVRVYPSSTRPHYIARTGPDAGTYVRVGSTNRRADAQLDCRNAAIRQERVIRRTADAGTRLGSPRLPSRFRAREEVSPVRKLTRTNIATLRLLTTHQGRSVPTVGGLLLFGQDRLDHFPDAWIQAGRFAGTDKAAIIDQAEFKMSLIQAIEEAIAFVEKHSLHGAVIGRLRRRERWSLPPAAVREAIVNAVAHADYSQQGAPIRVAIFDDRLEVENPGLLPFGLTLTDLPHGISKLRNRVIGRVLHELGLVEQWGSGVPRMLAACRESGLSPPVWNEIGVRLRVTLRTERVGGVDVDPTDRSILDLLEHGAQRSTREIAGAIGLSPRATRTRLGKLVARGLVREIGTGPRDPRRRYIKASD